MKLVFCFFLLIPHLLSAQQDDQILKRTVDTLEHLVEQYAQLGDHLKTLELHKKLYNKKLLLSSSEDVSTVRSLIKLAWAKDAAFKFQEARNDIEIALGRIRANPEKYHKILSEALLVNASIYKNEGDLTKAQGVYENYYEVLRQEENSYKTKFHIEGIIKMGLFYSSIHNAKKAFMFADLAYHYSNQDPLKNSITHLRALQALATINTRYHNFKKGVEYSEKGLALLEKIKRETPSKSILVEGIEPFLIITKAASEYLSKSNVTINFMESLLSDSKKAITALNRQKKLLTFEQGTNLLLAYNRNSYEFLKFLYFELYNKTNDPVHIRELLDLHESYLYNRIRLQLKSKDIAFNNIPDKLRTLEKAKSSSLLGAIVFNKDQTQLLRVQGEWQAFLDSIRLEHPKYYNFKYGSVVQSVGNLQQRIPENTTLVRYLYIYDRLFACVVSPEGISLKPIPYIDMALYLRELRKSDDIASIAPILHKLYNTLWKPIADKINTENIIIVPDQELFNLSFEMLTSKKVSSYEELASHSLISKYNISYNYSLFLIESETKILDFEKNFVAFVPEFNRTMKTDYELAITDSLELDKSYLTLLPQPFSFNLASKFTKKFNGSSFLNEKASKQVFSQTAKEHKIIHIGTHAEADNTNPELSRLVFAKNVADNSNINNNYLYTYEIYNQDLSSNLAILTACNTGKPTYQPGEGMISLAHAFNYAGSESILTSLWEIDEQSSAQIVDYFYGFLEKGLPKDKALREAKLSYLANSYDEALSPNYWAGLVLMGDVSPIKIAKNYDWVFWVLAALAFTIILYFLLRRKRINLS